MDRNLLGDKFCEKDTEGFFQSTSLTYSIRNCQMIQNIEKFPNCSISKFVGVETNNNKVPCKPRDIMLSKEKIMPKDGLYGDDDISPGIDIGCKRECQHTHYIMDITVGDIDLRPLENYLKSNVSLNDSKKGAKKWPKK